MKYSKEANSFSQDPLQALLMANLEQEGEAALRLNEKLKKDPKSEVPEEVRQRCRKFIQTTASQKKATPRQKPFGRFVRLAAIAAALLLLACACAAALGLDKLFLRYLGVPDKNSSLLGETAVTVDQSHTYENGWTISVRQAIADRYSVAILFQAQPPEGYDLALFPEDTPIYLNAGFDFSDSDPAFGPMDSFGFDYWSLGDSDQLSLITTQISLAGSGSLLGQTLSVSPYNLTTLPVDFREYPWSCTVTLPTSDPGLDHSVMQEFVLADEQITLGSVYVSPITLALTLDAPVGWESTEVEGWLDQVFLTTAEGKNIGFSQVYNWSADKTGHQQVCLRPKEILDPDEIASLTLWGQTLPLK